MLLLATLYALAKLTRSVVALLTDSAALAMAAVLTEGANCCFDKALGAP